MRLNVNNADTAVIRQNAVILANMAALTNAVISAIGEKYVARSINNESLTRDKIEHLALSRLTSAIVTS